MHSETVFIVDDDPSVRDSLSLILSLQGYATASFASAEDFLGALQDDWQGCLVVDIRMAGMSGLELQSCLQERGRHLPVIVITAHGDVAAARQAFLAEAIDFIEKPFDGEQILAAVAKAFAGLREVSVGRESSADPAPPRNQLSARERQVMLLIVEGLHNRHIADRLGISPRTVEVHKARVMDKLGAQNIVELVRLVDKGLV